MGAIAKIRPLVIVTGVALLLHGPDLPAGAQTGEYVELFSSAASAREPVPPSILGIAMPGSVERLDADLEALRSSSSLTGFVRSPSRSGVGVPPATRAVSLCVC